MAVTKMIKQAMMTFRISESVKWVFYAEDYRDKGFARR